MSWRNDVVQAFENLGGEADLAEAYEEIRRVRPNGLTPTFEATVRRTIESNSSDSEVWRRGDPNLFRKVGRGRWALRSKSAAAYVSETPGGLAALPEVFGGRVWIEFANHPVHGGEGWEFGKCLWSPTRAADGKDWYPTMRDVKEGDLVLHVLQGEFRGVSIAASAATELTKGPPKPEPWGGRPAYYRIDLRDYTPFPAPLNLDRVMVEHSRAIREEIASGQTPKFYPFVSMGGSLRKGQGVYLAVCTPRLYKEL